MIASSEMVEATYRLLCAHVAVCADMRDSRRRS